MLSLLSRLSRSRKPQANEPTTRAPRAASIETLEDRRLHSVSPGGEVSSFSWPISQPSGYRLPAVQTGQTTSATPQLATPQLAAPQTGGTNIIAILIG